MSKILENYLRAYRKQASLSQNEVAFLLGTRSGSKVSRYESSNRKPPLRVALGFAIIYRASVHDLFAGLEERERIRSASQARILVARIERHRTAHRSNRKIVTLKAIAAMAGQAS